MKLAEGILLITCGLGIAQSLFFALFLIGYREGARTSNLVLSALLIALAVRLAKSLTYYFFILDNWFMNVGYAAHLSLGPLLLIYILSLGRKWNPWHFIHLAPTLALIGGMTALKEEFWLTLGYPLLLYYSLVYLAVCWYQFLLLVKEKPVRDILRQWLLGLVGTVSLLCLAYYTNFILGLTPYIAGPVLYSFLIYGLTYLAFRYYDRIFGLRLSLRKNLKESPQQSSPQFEKLCQLLREEKLFLDPDISLAKLADRMAMPPYRLSKLINDHEAGFTALIHRLRIDEAKARLLDPSHPNQKVAVIAYEVGFQTLSAFNNAFKKTTGRSPSEYRKAMGVTETVT